MLIRNRKFARAHAGRSSNVCLKPDRETQESLALPNILPSGLCASEADTCPIDETITDMCPYVKMRITAIQQFGKRERLGTQRVPGYRALQTTPALSSRYKGHLGPGWQIS